MTNRLSVSLVETEQFLGAQYGPSVAHVAPLGAGGWSQAYSYLHNGSTFVIRWSQVADNFERDAVAARFSSARLPVPPILALGHAFHSFYAISPFVEGAFLETLSSTELDGALPSILGMFRALRDVDLSGTSGFGFWNGQECGSHASWRAFLLDDKDASTGSLIRGWRAKLEASSMGTSAYDQLWKSLEALVECCPEGRSPVHSDLLNRNVLVRSGEIAAVLDWGSSFYGDSLYDVAWFTFYEPWFPAFQELKLAQRLLDDFRDDPTTDKTNLDARLLCYLLDIGIGSIAYNAHIENWPNAEEASAYTLAFLR